MVVSRRLSRERRRAQLLDTALAIVRAEGADVLTLARLAEDAGVSKPVAYDHFETRTGLLIALYRRVDEQQTEMTRAALDAHANSLEETVRGLSEAYVDCVLHIGKEFGAVTAALHSLAGAEELLREGRERYAALYLRAVERFVRLPEAGGTALMLGVVGAAEALSREVTAGRLGRDAAVRATGHIMLGAVTAASLPAVP
ncbi:TetR/AcrR family transcriptional regulator [Streptomyces liangshanensis]|uniref:TetR/AcrR family transcriptional regulator n=1 Tax=Streptomyces liangshanensis TaxID=2717324 RepID=A0A6G9GUP2_9ACTN|nr:TetR/AcrR family transcriptional regulator [Streptomyces liangshanensis]QIQ01920.1 TetR/AcrR family transcriptional regulator [Streptomyces liangshanensis]